MSWLVGFPGWNSMAAFRNDARWKCPGGDNFGVYDALRAMVSSWVLPSAAEIWGDHSICIHVSYVPWSKHGYFPIPVTHRKLWCSIPFAPTCDHFKWWWRTGDGFFWAHYPQGFWGPDGHMCHGQWLMDVQRTRISAFKFELQGPQRALTPVKEVGLWWVMWLMAFPHNFGTILDLSNPSYPNIFLFYPFGQTGF